MRTLLVLVLLGGCSTYFGDDDTHGEGPQFYPDARPACPAVEPEDGSPCNIEQAGDSCYYEFDQCWCRDVGPSEYAWDCGFAYPDAGV